MGEECPFESECGFPKAYARRQEQLKPHDIAEIDGKWQSVGPDDGFVSMAGIEVATQFEPPQISKESITPQLPACPKSLQDQQECMRAALMQGMPVPASAPPDFQKPADQVLRAETPLTHDEVGILFPPPDGVNLQMDMNHHGRRHRPKGFPGAAST